MAFVPGSSRAGVGADDRETPSRALEDIIPILSAVCNVCRCELRSLSIYDPYYCNGGIKIRLESLGLDRNRIQNDPTDCYIAQKSGKVKPFDFLLSNPPYSSDHIRRCIHYCVKSQKPWALLLPSNVIHRGWFSEETKDSSILFVAPYGRYEFEVGTTSQSHVPLVTMWFVGFPKNDELKEKITQCWNNCSQKKGAVLADTFEGLPRKIRKLLPFTEVRVSLTSILELTESLGKGKQREKAQEIRNLIV
jgi:hypothetical protein